MEISQCPHSIAIEAFRKWIKRDTGLFVELTKIIPYSLNVVYKKAQNFVNVERELKPSRTLVSRHQTNSLLIKNTMGNIFCC